MELELINKKHSSKPISLTQSEAESPRNFKNIRPLKSAINPNPSPLQLNQPLPELRTETAAQPINDDDEDAKTVKFGF